MLILKSSTHISVAKLSVVKLIPFDGTSSVLGTQVAVRKDRGCPLGNRQHLSMAKVQVCKHHLLVVNLGRELIALDCIGRPLGISVNFLPCSF